MTSAKPPNHRPVIHSQRGVAVVEFAILLIPMLLLLFGVVEYGRAIYQYNTLVKSVRDATRYLSTVSPGNGSSIVYGSLTTWDVAKCMAVHGGVETDKCSGTPLAPGLNIGNVKICDAVSAGDCPGEPHSGVNVGTFTISLVTVKIVGYEYKPIFISFPLKLVGGSEITIGMPGIKFDDIHNTMRQPI